MTKTLSLLTPDSKKLVLAEFLWNFGRTLPHAILTVYLLQSGLSISRIATLQSIFMVVSMLMEAPSGVISDIFSRKAVYQASICSLFASYLLIGFFADNFFVLCLAYLLYGTSTALKSGSLEAEVVIEYRRLGKDIKDFTVAASYSSSISSVCGGFLGSFLYKIFEGQIYFFSLLLFVLSFLVSVFTYRKFQDSTEKKDSSVIKELKIGFSLLKDNKNLPFVLLLASFSALFLQPFFQFWQILYKECDFPIMYFGALYLIFQFCGIFASFLFRRIKFNLLTSILTLLAIPILFLAGKFFGQALIFVFPLTIVLFYLYDLFLDVLVKKVSPDSFISTFFSLINTIANIASIASLLLMTFLTEKFGVKTAYLVMFALFALASIFVLVRKRKLFLET